MLFLEQPTIPWRLSEIYLYCHVISINSSKNAGPKVLLDWKKNSSRPKYRYGLQLAMVTRIFLVQLEMKQLLLHQVLFNSKPIKGLTYLINKEFQQMSKKDKKSLTGKSQFTEKLQNSLNRSEDTKAQSKERCKIKH